MVTGDSSHSQTTTALDGPGLVALFAAAATHLEAAAPAVDAINVYPVPDGDTGSNMAATLREGVDAAARGDTSTAGTMLAELARGALYGARGNSGVILSQALRGLAEGAQGAEQFDAATLATALEQAAVAAYRAVGEPEEGTMLTVLRAAGEGAHEVAATLPGEGHRLPCVDVLRGATAAAERAEAKTPLQLPVLAEAGVTDAGGEGICVILRGLLAALTGEEIAAPDVPDRPLATLPGHDGDALGWCTEFVLESDPGDLDPTAIRRFAAETGARSVVVVGDASAVRVHVHTEDAEAFLAGARQFADPRRVKIEDMTAQFSRFGATGSGAGARVAVLALSPGPGFDAIFESLGATPARLDESAKPAAGTIANWADALACADVFILPNHTNVRLAAEQATELTRCTLIVVPARTVPQGIAAAFAFEPAAAVKANSEAMARATREVRTVEVTRAAASRTAEGIAVAEGQAIALVDGALALARDDFETALVEGLAAAGASQAEVLTVYAGEESAAEAQLLAQLGERFPQAEVQVLAGGQRLYRYIASVE